MPEHPLLILPAPGEAVGRRKKFGGGGSFHWPTRERQALQQILSLWELWRRTDHLPRGSGSWKTLFERLRDVRPWGVRDRLLETGVLDDWRQRLDYEEDPLPYEIELWYRRTKQQRQTDWQAVQRGTLQHEVLEGAKAAAFVDGSALEIQVNCRADAGVFEEAIPYALVTTLEVAEDLRIAVYDEIRESVRELVAVDASD